MDLQACKMFDTLLNILQIKFGFQTVRCTFEQIFNIIEVNLFDQWMASLGRIDRMIVAS